MGERPPPHGRSPTAPWAFAHRPVGVGFLLYRNAKEGKTILSLLLVRLFWVLFNQNALHTHT